MLHSIAPAPQSANTQPSDPHKIDPHGNGTHGAGTHRAGTHRAGTLQAITLLLPVTLPTMGIVVLLSILPAMADRFSNVPGIAFWIPVLLTIPSLVVVLFAPVAGYLSDLYGRRRILIASMLVYALAGMAPFVLENLYAILACRVVVGLCEAIALTVTTTMIGDYFKGPERDKWLGYQTAVASMSATVLIFIGGLLGGAFGWHGPFLIYGVSLILVCGVIFFTWEPRPDVLAGEHEGTNSWQGFPWKTMAEICALTLFGSYLFYLVQVELSFALALHGTHRSQDSGTLQSIASIGVPIGTIIFKYASRTPTARLLCAEYTILGLSLIGMGLAPNAHLLVAASFVNQLGAGMLLPTMLTWAMRSLPFEHRGRGTGVWTGTFSVGQFLLSVSFPAVSALTGGLLATFIAVGTSALIAALLALWMNVRRIPSPAAG